jgi:outer membrane beta-barrel protein
MKGFRTSLLCLAISLVPQVVLAEEVESNEGLSALAVQNRQHTQIHEIGAAIGLLPIDAFTKGLTVTGAYTVHFNDLIAWEIGQFTYAFGVDTELKEELRVAAGVQPMEFEVVKYFVTSNAVFKPLYGKLSLLNRLLLYGEMYLVAGGGWGRLTLTDRGIADFGAGVRIYAGRYVSFRLDVRDYMFITKGDVKSELWLGLSICLGLGRRDNP